MISSIEGVKTYIYDILVSIKEIFYNNICQIIVIFSSLPAAGLKFNTPKCWEGIKPDTKKGRVIM